MDILSPLAESPFNTTSTATTTADPKSTTDGAATTATGGLRRKNTLKAYLANKNKLKERQAINVIVDPSVLQREDSSGSEHEADSKTPFSPNSPTNNLMSPVSGKRIDTDLETLDDEKKAIEDQLAAITQQLNGKSPSSPSSPTAAGATSYITGATSGSPFEAADEAALIEKRTRLCAELDSIIKRRRELLQSWARDYKNLKRSGSLAKRQEDLFWVTTA